jgi:phosphoribosylformylglycinamidine (FGAM) synthase-like amidotransferase family enzyme
MLLRGCEAIVCLTGGIGVYNMSNLLARLRHLARRNREQAKSASRVELACTALLICPGGISYATSLDAAIATLVFPASVSMSSSRGIVAWACDGYLLVNLDGGVGAYNGTCIR